MQVSDALAQTRTAVSLPALSAQLALP